MKLLEFMVGLVDQIKFGIAKYEKDYKDLKGPDKMTLLNKEITSYFDSKWENVKLNFIIKGFLKKQIRNFIPNITQKVYDLIAIRIEGVTEKILNIK